MTPLAIALAVVGLALVAACWDMARRALAVRAALVRSRDDEAIAAKAETAARGVMDVKTAMDRRCTDIEIRTKELEGWRATQGLAKLGSRR